MSDENVPGSTRLSNPYAVRAVPAHRRGGRGAALAVVAGLLAPAGPAAAGEEGPWSLRLTEWTVPDGALRAVFDGDGFDLDLPGPDGRPYRIVGPASYEWLRMGLPRAPGPDVMELESLKLLPSPTNLTEFEISVDSYGAELQERLPDVAVVAVPSAPGHWPVPGR